MKPSICEVNILTGSMYSFYLGKRNLRILKVSSDLEDIPQANIINIHLCGFEPQPIKLEFTITPPELKIENTKLSNHVQHCERKYLPNRHMMHMKNKK